MKENVQKAVAWGKKNPVILVVVFAGIIFIFFRRPGIPTPAETPMIGDKVRGQAFPQPFEKTVLQEPEGYPVSRDDPAPQHVFIEIVQRADAPAPTRADAPAPTRAAGRVLDYAVVGAPAYKRAIAEAHARWEPGAPDRAVRNGLIQTAEHGWQTPEQIMARQRVRYDRAKAAGRVDDALKVRRETELAIGQRVGW